MFFLVGIYGQVLGFGVVWGVGFLGLWGSFLFWRIQLFLFRVSFGFYLKLLFISCWFSCNIWSIRQSVLGVGYFGNFWVLCGRNFGLVMVRRFSFVFSLVKLFLFFGIRGRNFFQVLGKSRIFQRFQGFGLVFQIFRQVVSLYYRRLQWGC